MFLSNALWLLTLGRSDSPGKRPRRSRPRATFLALEILEDRLCPSGSYLLVDSYNNNSVLRYDETTGAFVDEFVSNNSGGLYSGANMVFGPDHNLYVSNGLFSTNNKANDVLRYDSTTGAFLGVFADSGQLTDPRGVVFGPDGNLYVADGDGPGQVLRFQGPEGMNPGAFINTFVPLGSGGLSHPSGMLFGPDGNLYIIATDQSEVLRFQGPKGKNPGAFINTFVTPGNGGLNIPLSLAFGPDGNLYVANSHVNDSAPGGILRYNGKTGTFIDTFIPQGSGGLIKPLSLVFGPQGDLYVGSADTKFLQANPHASTVLRYDGTTGAFLDTFVAADPGGLRYPSQLLFTETDPVTLDYNGTTNTRLAAASAAPLAQALIPPTFPGRAFDSATISSILAAEAQIGSVRLCPNPVTAGASLTLTAANVVALNPGSTVPQVAFSLDNKGDAVQESGDTLLGYDHTDYGLLSPTLQTGVRETSTAVLDQLFASVT